MYKKLYEMFGELSRFEHFFYSEKLNFLGFTYGIWIGLTKSIILLENIMGIDYLTKINK